MKTFSQVFYFFFHLYYFFFHLYYFLRFFKIYFKKGTFFIVDCSDTSMNLMNISKAQDSIQNAFIYCEISITGLYFNDSINNNSLPFLMTVNSTLSINDSVISTCSKTFLLIYLSQIQIFFSKFSNINSEVNSLVLKVPHLYFFTCKQNIINFLLGVRS